MSCRNLTSLCPATPTPSNLISCVSGFTEQGRKSILLLLEKGRINEGCQVLPKSALEALLKRMEFAECPRGLGFLPLPLSKPCVTVQKAFRLPSLPHPKERTNLSCWWLRLLATVQRGHLCLINPGGKEGVGLVKRLKAFQSSERHPEIRKRRRRPHPASKANGLEGKRPPKAHSSSGPT